MEKASLIIVILLCCVILLVFYVIGVKNSLVNRRNKVLNQFSAIDVELKRRIDLIPNLVSIVKGYVKHEENTFKKVIKLRNMALKSETINDKVKSDKELSKVVNKLFAISENYPELKSNTNFIELQKELSDCEDRIAYAREFYNNSVMNYNNEVEMFPTSVVAKLFRYKRYDYYELDDREKEVPKV